MLTRRTHGRTLAGGEPPDRTFAVLFFAAIVQGRKLPMNLARSCRIRQEPPPPATTPIAFILSENFRARCSSGLEILVTSADRSSLHRGTGSGRETQRSPSKRRRPPSDPVPDAAYQRQEWVAAAAATDKARCLSCTGLRQVRGRRPRGQLPASDGGELCCACVHRRAVDDGRLACDADRRHAKEPGLRSVRTAQLHPDRGENARSLTPRLAVRTMR